MRRIASIRWVPALVLSISLMGGSLAWTSPAWANFSDVLETDEYYAAVTWLADKGVIEGYDDGTAGVDREVTRAEALKMILLTSGIEVSLDFTAEDVVLYSDVTSADWYFTYVDVATDRALTQGYDDGSFLPNQTINLAEALKIITLAQGAGLTTPTEAPFADVAADVWFAPAVEYAKNRQFIAADSDGLLHPDHALTRGELMEILYRFGYTSEQGLSSFPLALNWPTYQHPNADFAFQYPFDWILIEADDGSIVLWHQDETNGQTSWLRTYPLSAMVVIRVDANEAAVGSSDYFLNVEAGMAHYEGLSAVTTVTEPGYVAFSMAYRSDTEVMDDLIIDMPENPFVILQATYGQGSLESQWANYVEAIQNSVVASEAPPSTSDDPAEAVETARAAIQVDGQGTATLELFADRELIETDTLGIGTGPVDYYYSVWADITLKYERSLDVILDIEEGQTTAF